MKFSRKQTHFLNIAADDIWSLSPEFWSLLWEESAKAVRTALFQVQEYMRIAGYQAVLTLAFSHPVIMIHKNMNHVRPIRFGSSRTPGA